MSLSLSISHLRSFVDEIFNAIEKIFVSSALNFAWINNKKEEKDVCVSIIMTKELTDDQGKETLFLPLVNI